MAGVDPITLSVVGATIGAATNKNDPVKGAVIGGGLGYAGGNILGAGAPATATQMSVAPESLKAVLPELGVQQAAQMSYAPGTLQAATAATPAAAMTGQNAYRNLMAAQLLAQLSGGTRTNVSPPQIRGGKQVNLADPVLSLLQPQMRRRQPLSLLG